VNPNRSTHGDTPLAWLNIIQRGGTQDWRALYALCQDRSVAEEVARMLRFRDPDLMASARLWKFLLEDLHPGLKIDLREAEGLSEHAV
jgi:hypothetical protein